MFSNLKWRFFAATSTAMTRRGWWHVLGLLATDDEAGPNEDRAIMSIKSGEFDNPPREGERRRGEKKGGHGQRFVQGPRTNLFAWSLPVPRFGTRPRVSAGLPRIPRRFQLKREASGEFWLPSL